MLRDNRLFRARFPVEICGVESGKSAILLGGPPAIEPHIFVFSRWLQRVLEAVLQIKVSCWGRSSHWALPIYRYTNRI
jgi:hypothetical protein